MTKREAIKCVWERMAVTAEADVANGDWMFEESEDPKDHERLIEACEHVSAVCSAKARGRRIKP